MHMYAKHIGEVIKEHYCPEDMMCSETAHEDLKELGEWVDIMKDLAAYDRDMKIIETMNGEEHVETVEKMMTEEEIIAKIKHFYAMSDATGKAKFKVELTKIIQTM